MDLLQVETETPVASPEVALPAHDVAPPTTTLQDGANPPAEAEAGADQQASEEQPKPRPIQKRISELVRERETARREADYWREQAQIARPPEPAPQQQQAAPITPEQFPTYEDYLIARAEEKASARIQTELAARAEQHQRMAEDRARATTVAEFQARADEARNRYEDFDLVVSDPSTPITPIMADAIVQSGSGHEVAYYLGRHKQEAARIARLPPLGQAMEIARLEGRLAAAPRRATAAPPPPQTVAGLGSPSRNPATASTYEEYKALRMQKVR
jgi:hypothetical protein